MLDYWNLIVYVVSIVFACGLNVSKINSLEKQVTKHNSVIERTYKIEGEIMAINSRLTNIEDNIERLEK